MTVKINTIELTGLRSAAVRADNFGNRDGNLDANELSVFASQARRNGCDSADIAQISADASGSELKTYGKAKETERNNNRGEEVTVASIKAEMQAQEAEKADSGEELGRGLYFNIKGGGTSARQHNFANEKLKEVNKDNVMSFMKGYYDQKGGLDSWYYDTEGLMEHLDDECDGGRIELENKINVVTSLLKRAKESGLDKESDSYDKLVSTLYKYGDYNEETCEVDNLDESRKNLKHTNKQYWGIIATGTSGFTGLGAVVGGTIGGPIGAVIGAAVAGAISFLCFRRRDSEAMDDCMKELYGQIRAKEEAKA